MRCTSVLQAFVCGILLQAADVWAAGPACGDDPGDAAAVAEARAEIDGLCNCAGVPDHGTYVRCASAVLTLRVGSGQLRSPCKGAVKKCAARSTCGKPDAVTCCRTTAAGRLKCSVKSDAAHCRAPKNGSACVGTVPSCCDACGSGNCVPSTTATSTSTTTSTTSTSIATPCGDTYVQCNGSCPDGLHCAPEENFPPNFCTCVPAGTTPCSSSSFPTCGGTCSGGSVCGPVRVYVSSIGTIEYCGCLDPASNCSGSFSSGGMCPGVCPSGTTCYGEPEGGGFCVGCFPLVFGTTTIPTTPTTTPTTSTTSTTIAVPCGGTFPICNGSCGAGEICTEDGLPGTSCVCMPLGLEPCDGATFPTCGGTCTGSGVCGRVTIYTSTTGAVNSCACLDPAATCSGSFNDAMCPGLCPTGTTCYGEPEPAGIGNCVGCLPLFLFP